ncbi:MAG: hypothetical protein Q9223_003664 [Gallowayella weberi]
MKKVSANGSAAAWFSYIPSPRQDASEISTAEAMEPTASTQLLATKHGHDMTLSTAHMRSTQTGNAPALALFHQHVPYYINIDPWAIRQLNESLPFVNTERKFAGRLESYHFRNHLDFEQLPSFKSLRNYRLNLSLGDMWYIGSFEGDQTWFSHICSRFKEQLRLVCDSLASNDDIQSLFVTVPCQCCFEGGCQTEEALSTTLDFLAPLKRLRVAKSVVLRAVYDDGHDCCKGDVWLDPCCQPKCKELGRDIQAALGHLVGEPLSKEEMIWKDLKAMDTGMVNIKSWDTLGHYHHFWARLNYYQKQLGRSKRIGREALRILGDIAELASKSILNDYDKK